MIEEAEGSRFSRRQLLMMTLLLRRRIQSQKRKKYQKRMWVRKIFDERKTKGEFHHLVQDMKLLDREYFFQYFRMTVTQYEELLQLVAPVIMKSGEKREPISPSERLTVTLRYLITGNSHVSLKSNFRMHPTTIGRIIRETCTAIWDMLSPTYLKCPQNEEEWKKVAEGFDRKWNFPHCLGAIDGKHVVMQAPARSGSSFFNYKKTHSIVLLAVCDAQYKFILVDIGDSGRNSDGGVFTSSNLGYAIDHNLLGMPKPEEIGSSGQFFPYVFVGDEAFRLSEYMMKPYPREILALLEMIFNYRLSRARRVIENTFGIAAARFQILRRPIIGKVDLVVGVTKAVVALHNYLMHGKSFETNVYCPPGFSDSQTGSGVRRGAWRNEVNSIDGLVDIPRLGSNNYTKRAREIRECFRNYFSSPEGEVPWQYEYVTSTHDRFDRR